MENTLQFKVKIGVKDLFRFLMEYNYKSIGGAFGLVISFACFGMLAYSFSDNSAQVNLLLLVVGLLFTVIQPLMLLKKAAVVTLRNEPCVLIYITPYIHIHRYVCAIQCTYSYILNLNWIY